MNLQQVELKELGIDPNTRDVQRAAADKISKWREDGMRCGSEAEDDESEERGETVVMGG